MAAEKRAMTGVYVSVAASALADAVQVRMQHALADAGLAGTVSKADAIEHALKVMLKSFDTGD